MPRLCPNAVGGESGSTHPMHARSGPCRAGTPFTFADAPAHCRPILLRSCCNLLFFFAGCTGKFAFCRSRVHYDSLSCLFIWRASYMLCTTLADPVFHIHSFFVFVFLCSSSSSWRCRRRRRIRTHAIKPSRAAATFLFFLHRIVTILINGYSNAGHYNHKYDLQTTAEHENESRTSWQVTHFQIPHIFEASREIAIVTVIEEAFAWAHLKLDDSSNLICLFWPSGWMSLEFLRRGALIVETWRRSDPKMSFFSPARSPGNYKKRVERHFAWVTRPVHFLENPELLC